MGRVGSNTVAKILHNAGIKHLHAHWLSGEFPDAEFPTTKLKIINLIKSNKSPPLKVIVPIREPLARNLSAFTFSLIKYGISGRGSTSKKLKELFLNKYNIYYPDLWFEKELMDIFDFDPFLSSFNYKRGYKIYKSGKHKFLIYRLEDIKKALRPALRKFLGIKKFEITHESNLGTKKYIGDSYTDLKNETFPKEFLDKIYNLKYVNHFYTNDEIRIFKEKWMNGN
jgi:hypothetical protein